MFQSTHPRKGCDPDDNLVVFFCDVSTHAPTRVRPILSHVLQADSVVSIHALRERCDFITISSALMFSMFQSTHPRRVRLSTPEQSVTLLRKFQLTHPRRGRQQIILTDTIYYSIPNKENHMNQGSGSRSTNPIPRAAVITSRVSIPTLYLPFSMNVQGCTFFQTDGY